MHIFNPTHNPIASELLRLQHPPYARLYEPEERTFVAESLVAKLYGLQRYEWPRHRRWGRWINTRQQRVSIQIIWLEMRNPIPAPNYRADPHHLITVGIGRGRVAEIYNGYSYRAELNDWECDRRLRLLANDGADELEPDPEGLPHRTDAELTEAYGGPPDNVKNGGDGGNGGNGGDGGGVDVPGNGSGGLGEVLGHPVLFAVDIETFNNILEQT